MSSRTIKNRIIWWLDDYHDVRLYTPALYQNKSDASFTGYCTFNAIKIDRKKKFVFDRKVKTKNP